MPRPARYDNVLDRLAADPPAQGPVKKREGSSSCGKERGGVAWEVSCGSPAEPLGLCLLAAANDLVSDHMRVAKNMSRSQLVAIVPRGRPAEPLALHKIPGSPHVAIVKLCGAVMEQHFLERPTQCSWYGFPTTSWALPPMLPILLPPPLHSFQLIRVHTL